MWQLSLCATTTEACSPRAHALQKEGTTMRSLSTAKMSNPRSSQTEKAEGQQGRPSSQK